MLDGAVPFMAGDFASGQETVKRGDDTAMGVAFLKWLENSVQMFVVDVRGGRWKPDRVVDCFFSMVEMWRPRKIFLETNAYKEWLMTPLRKGALEKGLHLPIEEVTQSRSTGGKDRIFALVTPYTYRQVWHAEELKNSKAEEQILRFQPGGKEHDDYPDMLSMIWIHGTKKRHSVAGGRIRIIKHSGGQRYKSGGL